MSASVKLMKALAVAIELTGTELSRAAAGVMAEELATYPEAHVLAALRRCTCELRGRMSMADILDRLPGGHPGPEEAWSIVSPCLNNEAITVVWTREMAQAFGISLGLKDDLVAARMAFKESYQGLIAAARSEGRLPVWTVSPGTDKDARELAVLDAVEKGRISATYAQNVLPYHREDVGLNARLLASAGNALKRLGAPT